MRVDPGARGIPAEPERKDRPKKGEVPSQAREVVKSLLARATGPLNPSLIKETLVRREPGLSWIAYVVLFVALVPLTLMIAGEL